jgi:hypothetical protein
MYSHTTDKRNSGQSWPTLPVVVAAIAALVSTAAADLTVTIRTDANIANLYLLQPVTFEVVISGLEPGQQLDYLGVTVAADPYRMGAADLISPGEIVPSVAASQLDFLTSSAPGVADASFYTTGGLPAHRITTDGVFFTFDFSPQHAGGVSLEVIYAEALMHNSLDEGNPVWLAAAAMQPLEVTIFCPADFNNDGGVDGADADAFFADWESGTGLADVNGDGGIDGADVVTFFSAWEAGGC